VAPFDEMQDFCVRAAAGWALERMHRIVDLADSQFDEMVLCAKEPVLVYFWARWCGPCKLVTLILEEIVAVPVDSLRICKIDVETDRVAMVKYNVQNVPTLILFKEGAPIGMRVGAVSRTQLLAFLNSAR
jgi:thioredoxin 1